MATTRLSGATRCCFAIECDPLHCAVFPAKEAAPRMLGVICAIPRYSITPQTCATNKGIAMRSHTLPLTAALALALSTVSHPVAAADAIVLKFGSFVSPKSITNEVSVPAFIKEVEAASEGTLKIEHYPGGTLSSNPATQLKLVEDGVLDSAEVVASYTPGRFRELDMFELPFIFNNTQEAGLTAWALYEKRLLSGFDNLVLLGIAEVGPYTLHARKNVSTLTDVSGMKIRAGGPIFGETIKAMGGIPVGGMPATQIAENISRGVLDATLMDGGNLFNFRITDAARYHVVNVQLGNIAVMFPLNKRNTTASH
jgi:TRAP-type C4-dicarboxylate transport system substrate-binding protein